MCGVSEHECSTIDGMNVNNPWTKRIADTQMYVILTPNMIVINPWTKRNADTRMYAILGPNASYNREPEWQRGDSTNVTRYTDMQESRDISRNDACSVALIHGMNAGEAE